MAEIATLHPLIFQPILRRALEEDLGLAGDMTSDVVVPEHARAHASLVSRKPGRIAGLQVALATFAILSPEITTHSQHEDGDDVTAGSTLARVEGPARAILTAERTALNLVSLMSGIATATRAAAKAVEGTTTRISCTRKTTPGLRALEKYAVRVGGGINHRFGLDDGVLIKDNHIAAVGGIRNAVTRARQRLGHMVKIEVEVDTLDQLRELIAVGADAVLLDNMAPPTLREAVGLVDGRMITEASGGMSIDVLPAVAATGVDIVSIGWLTHSAPILDIGLDIEPV
ncbi:MAG: carboxylating nicotinate-nucleotide diphosphorylase [Defluviicoccus sp.]|nr:carboxylating nicotinate-nucleotide diphosphorylase [Defluviicoccus sp.]MDG4592873.1 carboxylating nicotinate-nucleotide diphosphorylase [Defluviicoccus sp.]MDS4010224.1 carboxylating nicotinate-nucleotide diphosphorylase [Defluviicoccus sp.]MDS4072988.1 carboxylating nicotinate-nucleotide diphosphorylase [Defluviicoccus sp.]